MNSSFCCQSSDLVWLVLFFWKWLRAFCCLRNLLNCSFPWPEFFSCWDMLVIITPLGLLPVLRWPPLVLSSQQLTDYLVIINHSIFEKTRRRFSDYLVTQRKACSCQTHASSTSIQPAQTEAKSLLSEPWEIIICQHHLWVTSSYFYTFFTWGF